MQQSFLKSGPDIWRDFGCHMRRLTFFLFLCSITLSAASFAWASPCDTDEISAAIRAVYEGHLRSYFLKGEISLNLLKSKGMLGKELATFIDDDKEMGECDPGNLHCVDSDLLFMTQDFWEDAKIDHVTTNKVGKDFETSVRIAAPDIKDKKMEYTLSIKCSDRPVIEDVSSEGRSYLQTIKSCFLNENEHQYLKECRRKKGGGVEKKNT